MHNFMDVLIPFLLNPITSVLALVLLILGCITLAAARKQLSTSSRIAIAAAVLLCALYLIFLLWALVGFNSAPSTAPTPMAA